MNGSRSKPTDPERDPHHDEQNRNQGDRDDVPCQRHQIARVKIGSYWLIRGPASATFPAVEAFVRSGQAEATITLQPLLAEPIRRRALRLGSPDGELSVFLTNLADPVRFPAAAITAYFTDDGHPFHGKVAGDFSRRRHSSSGSGASGRSAATRVG